MEIKKTAEVAAILSINKVVGSYSYTFDLDNVRIQRVHINFLTF